MASLGMNPTTHFSESTEMVKKLVALLKDRKITISVAESCSGGLLAKMLTDIPGSSEYFLAGVVAYSNSSKSSFLGIPLTVIEYNGAVSAEVAEAMAEGMRNKAESDIALSITGIAGPDGGTEQKPLGTVFLGLADSNGSKSMLLSLDGNRDQIRNASVRCAIDWAIRHLSCRLPATQKACS